MGQEVFTPEQQSLLLQVAREAIQYGWEQKKAWPPDPSRYPEALRLPRAVFVTLTLAGDLRGCIGVLEPGSTLVENVAKYAYAAAFQDARFPDLSEDEIPKLEINISILSLLEPMAFQSEEDLMAQIRPGIDGLFLEDGYHRGTFLPAVWEDLPEVRDFLRRLKGKAGLPADYWSDQLRVRRYTTTCISDAAAPHP